MPSPRCILLAALLAGASACGSGASRAVSEPSPEGAARLEVDNASSVDMDIFLRRSSQQIRLGLAPANQTTRFTLSEPMLTGSGTVQFDARPVSGGRGETVRSDVQTVRPGDVIRWRIPPQ